MRESVGACHTVHMHGAGGGGDERGDTRRDSTEGESAGERGRSGAGTHVEVVEVGPRDGLQSDPSLIGTEAKVELIGRAVKAGVRRIEAVSFVNPKRVPQMADADEVMAALPREMGVNYIGLVLNRRGLERAIETRVDEINVVVVASDTFARRNQGDDTFGLVEAAAEICRAAREAWLPATVTVAASFGCPYEGEVPPSRLRRVLERIVEAEPAEIALADSIGAASPRDVRERLAVARSVIGDANIDLRCHFHNTRNTGLANAVAAVEAGVRILDASIGGIGGCPFAPDATGNIPTEDLVYLLHRMGHPTGIDLGALVEHVPWLVETLEHSVPGLVSRAGVFPGSARGADEPGRPLD